MKERTVEVYRDRQWKTIRSLIQIQSEDVFRMYEPEGDPVLNKNGNTWFVAKQPGFIRSDGHEMVRIYE